MKKCKTIDLEKICFFIDFRKSVYFCKTMTFTMEKHIFCNKNCLLLNFQLRTKECLNAWSTHINVKFIFENKSLYLENRLIQCTQNYPTEKSFYRPYFQHRKGQIKTL